VSVSFGRITQNSFPSGPDRHAVSMRRRAGTAPREFAASAACGKAAWMPGGAVCSRWPAATRERRPAAGCFRSRPVGPATQHPAPIQASTDIRAAGTCCSRPGSVLGLDYLSAVRTARLSMCGLRTSLTVRSQDMPDVSTGYPPVGTGAVREVPSGSAGLGAGSSSGSGRCQRDGGRRLGPAAGERRGGPGRAGAHDPGSHGCGRGMRRAAGRS
jgi:hypothetical protein